MFSPVVVVVIVVLTHMYIFTQLDVLFSVIYIILESTVIFTAFFLIDLLSFFSQDKVRVPSESSQLRVGKWKVPSSQNYLALYKSLLDCDQLKVQL